MLTQVAGTLQANNKYKSHQLIHCFVVVVVRVDTKLSN